MGRIYWQKCFCVCDAFFSCNFGMRSERKQISICFICKKKKKNPFLWFRYAALSTSLVPSLSSVFHSLSKWHLQMTRPSRVSWAEGRNRGAEGESEGRERETGSERLSLNISPTPTRHASQPAVCSPLSFLFYQSAEKKKINSYFHNPHSCLSTCLWVSPSSIPLSLPWGRLTPPPRSYGVQMSLRWATITAETKGGLALSWELGAPLWTVSCCCHMLASPGRRKQQRLWLQKSPHKGGKEP